MAQNNINIYQNNEKHDMYVCFIQAKEDANGASEMYFNR